MKTLGIYLLIIGCWILIIIKWCLWIPYMLFVFPFTELFMHAYELPMYPYYWIDALKEKL